MKLEDALKMYYKTCLLACETHRQERNAQQVQYISCMITALTGVATLGGISLQQEYNEVMKAE